MFVGNKEKVLPLFGGYHVPWEGLVFDRARRKLPGTMVLNSQNIRSLSKRPSKCRDESDTKIRFLEEIYHLQKDPGLDCRSFFILF